MAETILFIDGENFRHKVENLLKEKHVKGKIRLENLDFNSLLETIFPKLKIDRKIYYAAKIHDNPETPKKSEELITAQRNLKTKLEKAGFQFIISGNIRSQKINSRLVFREKGVDVRIAVDLVANACDGKVSTAILCSSDSDLQPAIAEIKNRNVKTVYLGFKDQPNLGLKYTCGRYNLIGTEQIIKSYKPYRKNDKRR
jgi:uncharacterized LabA/DUF88 family protein